MNDQRINLFSELKKRVIQCEYKPGSTLNEKKLCKEFKVSRTPYREALIKLEAEGLVEIHPKKGVVVTSIDINSLREMFEMRSIIEKISAQFAFYRIQPNHLKAMKDIADKLEALSPEDFAAHAELDAKFHTIIADAQRNQLLAQFQSKLREQHIRLWNSLDDQEKFRKLRIATIRDIKNIYKAFVEKDLSAIEAGIKEHFNNYLSVVVSQLITGVEIDFHLGQNGNSSFQNKS